MGVLPEVLVGGRRLQNVVAQFNESRQVDRSPEVRIGAGLFSRSAIEIDYARRRFALLESPAVTEPRGLWGMEVEMVGELLVVVTVSPRGPACQAGVLRGDQIISVGGSEPVGSVHEFYKLTDGSNKIEMRVRRANRTVEVSLERGQLPTIEMGSFDDSVDSAPPSSKVDRGLGD